MSEIKPSTNNTQVIGTLDEMNLEETTKEVTLRGANGVEKKVQCRHIAKKEFRNPMFTVDVNEMTVGVDFFPVSEKKLDDNGNIVDNPRFASMETVMNKYVTKLQAVKDGSTPTRVKIDGNLAENLYIDGNTFEPKSIQQVQGFQITSSSVPEDDIADCEITGVIGKIIPETNGSDGEETGRLKVTLYTFNRNAEVIPFTFIVEQDLVDDFTSFYEVGQSVKLYYEIITKQVGQQKQTTGGFGRRESHRVSGFSVTEYSVFRGSEPFDEENEYFVDVDTVKQALNERDIKIDNMVKAKKEEGSKPKTSSPKGASGTAKANPFGSSTKKSPF